MKEADFQLHNQSRSRGREGNPYETATLFGANRNRVSMSSSTKTTKRKHTASINQVIGGQEFFSYSQRRQVKIFHCLLPSKCAIIDSFNHHCVRT